MTLPTYAPASATRRASENALDRANNARRWQGNVARTKESAIVMDVIFEFRYAGLQ
jgi:hypothetical protein